MHRREISQIEERIPEIVPTDFGDAMDLLGFAARGEREEVIPDGLALSILDNAIEALPGIWHDEKDKAVKKAVEEAKVKERENFRFAHMRRFGSRDEIYTRMNNTPAAVSVSKV